jgi:hypothetical protein
MAITMSRIDGILCDKPPDGRTRSGWRAFLAAVGARLQDSSVRRPRRVLLLVIVLWVLNAFDLKFTLLAQHIGGFIEMNPLARMFVSDSGALIAYKFALIIPATVIFLALRRRLITEVGCWLLLAAHVALAFIWREYYMPM